MKRWSQLSKLQNIIVGLGLAAILSFGLIGAPTSTVAQTVAANAAPLTPELVEGLIATYPLMRAHADKLEAANGLPDTKIDNPAAAFGAYMASQNVMAEFDAIVQPYGFENMQHWISVMSSAAMTMAFAREGGDMGGQMAEAIKQIESNPDISDQQKQMMLDQFKKMSGAMAALVPSQANMDAVEPYAAQLKAVLEAD